MAEPDPILVNDWHAVVELEFLATRGSFETVLLGVPIEISEAGAGSGEVRVVRRDTGAALPARLRYGHVFTSIGQPNRDIAHFPECFEEDRIHVTGGSIAVHVSGLRAVENFLDMGHFPFVHTDYLGVEPHTEVEPYEVRVTEEDEILATKCRFFQPLASPSADGGMMVDYEYRVSRPYTVCLYKSNPIEPERWDFIVLFVQPVSEERCIAHPYLSYLPPQPRQRHQPLVHAAHLRAGQADPREPASEAPAPRPPGGDPRALRCVVARVPALADRAGRDLRRDPGRGRGRARTRAGTGAGRRPEVAGCRRCRRCRT